MTPRASADLALMRASMLLDSDPAAAAAQAGEILASWPEHEEASLLLASACRRMGDPAKASGVLESLVRMHPRSSVLQLELGRAHASAGNANGALEALQRAVDFDAALAEGWRELAAQYFALGETLLGDRAYARYAPLATDPPALLDARVALADDRRDAAEALTRRYLHDAPGNVAALHLLADVATRRGDTAETERCLRRCLDLAPGDASAREELARLLHSQERSDEAVSLIERLLTAEPENTRHLSLKAQAIRLQGRNDEAITLMERAITLDPDDAQLWLIFGNLLREIGEQARSIESYRRALSVQPAFGEAYWALANLKTFRFTDEDLETMRREAARGASAGRQRIHLEFALGKACEDLEQFETSFEHYARGNSLQRAVMEYDASATREFVERSKALYTQSFFADRAGWGAARRDPIFIVGLPRSGSTLLEQILSSHSQVEGTGELQNVHALVMELASAGGTGVDRWEYPGPVASLRRDEIDALSVRYLEQTASRRPRALPHFVDKMLGNFSHIGLIHLMFPNAVIIDARRHPMGCGFSCYKQLFARGMNFSYDLDELGRYYRDYAELMHHMDAVLPGRVYRVNYEKLVADPEHEVRGILKHCGLSFEAECLRFYNNPRIVQTVSSEQVRRPIYPHGVDQWRHYERWLGPIKNALGDLAEQ